MRQSLVLLEYTPVRLFQQLAVLLEPREVRTSVVFGSPSVLVPSVAAGCLELLNFTHPEVLQQETRSREWHNPPSAAPVRCNALAFWLWIQAGPVPQESSRTFTAGKTMFPYGCPDTDVVACRPAHAPTLSNCVLDFDGGGFSHGWRNFVLFFAGPPEIVADFADDDSSSEAHRSTLPPKELFRSDAQVASEDSAVASVSPALPTSTGTSMLGSSFTVEESKPHSDSKPATAPSSIEHDNGGITVLPGGSLKVDTRVHVKHGRAPWYHVVVRIFAPLLPSPVLTADVLSLAGAEASPRVPSRLHMLPVQEFSCVIDTSGGVGEEALVHSFLEELHSCGVRPESG